MWLLIACTSCSRLDEIGYWSLRQRSESPRQPGFRASPRFRLAGSRVELLAVKTRLHPKGMVLQE